MTKMLMDIIDFHHKFGLVYEGDSRELPASMARFRLKFMYEELEEYKQAMYEGDKAKMLDALVDLVYVVLGTAYLHGFPFETAWDRVQTANMTKERGHSTRSGQWDVVKPAGFRPPDLSDLVK